MGIIVQMEPKSPVQAPQTPTIYYPLTLAAPQNEYINIISSVNKRSLLESMRSFILSFKNVKRPYYLVVSKREHWYHQKFVFLRQRNGLLVNK